MELYNNTYIPHEWDNRIRKELRKNENLIWVGQPVPKRFAISAIPFVLFGIPWTAFSIFWMAAAGGFVFGRGPDTAGIIFSLFGLPFVLIGFGLLSSPYWEMKKAKNTFYVLTTNRAILWQAGLWGSIQISSYEPEELKKRRRREYSHGQGDIIFEDVIKVRTSSHGNRTQTKSVGFIGIDNVQEIDELLQQALFPEKEKQE